MNDFFKAKYSPTASSRFFEIYPDEIYQYAFESTVSYFIIEFIQPSDDRVEKPDVKFGFSQDSIFQNAEKMLFDIAIPIFVKGIFFKNDTPCKLRIYYNTLM